MIFYAMLSGASIGALFLGGIIPGLIVGLALMGYTAVIAKKRNYPEGQSLPAKEFISLTFRSLPALFSVVVLLGGIYTGVVTPTEAGALAATWALIVSVFFYRAFGWKDIRQVLLNTVKATGTLSLLVGCAYAFSYIVAVEKIPNAVAGLLLGMTDNKYVMLLVINLMFLGLGMFIDTMAITLVFIPIVMPLIKTLGIDLTHFGVVIVLNMMIGLSTPPYGMLLFVVSGISKTPLKRIIREIFPMIIILVCVLFLLTYVPDLVLFIPRLAGFK
jgi:tripartite ATP-independent transporter DctM subunit